MQELVAVLLALMFSLTGIGRTVDPVLQADAERRVIEIQSNWSHVGMAYTEILAFNSGTPDPVVSAIEQWDQSPGHHQIMYDPTLTRVGCAVDETSGTWYFACSFAAEAVAAPAPVPRAPSVAPTPVLPNTAMEGG
jgi:hypothetical protein